MQPSLTGLLVCGVVFLVGRRAGSPLIVSLLVSFAFGSTAALTLSALGGSSPLIYTLFSALLVAAVAARRRIWRDLGRAFARVPDIWLLCALMAYAVVSAVLMPRLFAGATTAFSRPPGTLGIVEMSLGPVSGNITQTGYFVLNGLTAIALCLMLLHRPRWDEVRRAFLLWCAFYVAFGLLDLGGKLLGFGDVLAPIRTANYAMLTESSEIGFHRITGAFPEASSFATAGLSCLAFAYTYWTRTGSRSALVVGATVLGLLVLSTSTTAYVGLAALGVVAGVSVLRAALAFRLERRQLLIVAALCVGLAAALAIALHEQDFFDPLLRLVRVMVFEKGASASGRERGYMNAKSLQAFLDTWGLGIGLGSSRASSWPVAVASQLGVLGSLMMGTLLLRVVAGIGPLARGLDPATLATVASVRAAALASLFAATIVAGSADPGIVFFVGFAVICAARASLRAEARAPAGAAVAPRAA